MKSSIGVCVCVCMRTFVEGNSFCHLQVEIMHTLHEVAKLIIKEVYHTNKIYKQLISTVVRRSFLFI
jgi:hypothetical protein